MAIDSSRFVGYILCNWYWQRTGCVGES